MREGREEAEWGRLANLMAFVKNCLRFSEKDPICHPKDLNPYYVPPGPPAVPKDMKDRMNDFFASPQGQKIPLRTMKLVDGIWTEVS